MFALECGSCPGCSCERDHVMPIRPFPTRSRPHACTPAHSSVIPCTCTRSHIPAFPPIFPLIPAYAPADFYAVLHARNPTPQGKSLWGRLTNAGTGSRLPNITGRTDTGTRLGEPYRAGKPNRQLAHMVDTGNISPGMSPNLTNYGCAFVAPLVRG